MSESAGLATAIARFVGEGTLHKTALDGLNLYRSEQEIGRQPIVYDPTICVIAQGRKKIYFGDYTSGYDRDNYLINSLTMPIEAEVVSATPDKPYLGLSLAIDPKIVSQLMLEMDRLVPQAEAKQASSIISSAAVTDRLSDCFVRLVSLLDSPVDLEILAHGLKREIYYEVLKGPQGHLLRNCVTNLSGANRIAPVVHYIEENFHRSLDIETLAGYASMSTSSLHAHFKQVTSMSPMQFVKTLRLHKARLMLLSGDPASEASYRVGYSSPSQFSREFKRFFGDSPREVLASAVA